MYSYSYMCMVTYDSSCIHSAIVIIPSLRVGYAISFSVKVIEQSLVTALVTIFALLHGNGPATATTACGDIIRSLKAPSQDI